MSDTTLLVVFSGRGDPPSPLSGCRGDCDNDEQCEGDLLCFERAGTEAVPGCEGTGEPGVDYCFSRPSENFLWVMGNNGIPAEAFPLGSCEADCGEFVNPHFSMSLWILFVTKDYILF